MLIDLPHPRDPVATRGDTRFVALRQRLFSSIFMQERRVRRAGDERRQRPIRRPAMRARWPGLRAVRGAVVRGGALLRLRAGGFAVDPTRQPHSHLVVCQRRPRRPSYQLIPSLGRIFVGCGLAALVAIPLGLLMGTSAFVYRLLEPLTEFIRPIPAAAYIPIAILFLGIGNEMKVFVVFLACLFPILLNTYGGVRGVDQVLVDTGRTFGVPHWKALWQITFPAALPSILTGLRISLGIALIVSVVSEMIAGNSGIGYFILDMQRGFPFPEMFAGIFTLGMPRLSDQFRVPAVRAPFPALAGDEQ